MTHDDLLSKTITYLRFPLCVGVVFIHFNLARGELIIRGVKHGLDNPDWYFFIIRLISEVIATIGVPLFFVFSGFLFFYRKDFSYDIYKQKLKTRVKTLLVPFFLWNIIAILWRLKCFLPVVSSFYSPTEIQISFKRLFNTFFCLHDNNGIFVVEEGVSTLAPIAISPIDAPLWYVRDLMIVVILSPIIYRLIKNVKSLFVIILGLIWFGSSHLFLKVDSTILCLYASQVITAFFFFSWGAYYSINKENIVNAFYKLKYAPIIYVVFVIVDTLTKGMDYNIFIHKIGILCGIVSAIVVASKLLSRGKVKVNHTLANATFFIFALHFLFIRDVGKFAFTMLHIPENNPYVMLILYFAVPVFSIIICLFFYLFLKRYAPRICSVLTGGR